MPPLPCASWQMAAVPVLCEMCLPVAALCFRCVTRQGSQYCGTVVMASCVSQISKNCRRDVNFISDVSIPTVYSPHIISVYGKPASLQVLPLGEEKYTNFGGKVTEPEPWLPRVNNRAGFTKSTCEHCVHILSAALQGLFSSQLHL